MRYSGKVGYNGVDTSLPTQHGTKQKSFGAPYNGKGDVCGVLLDMTAHTLTFLKYEIRYSCGIVKASWGSADEAAKTQKAATEACSRGLDENGLPAGK